jgi:endo-1,3(4)-beta-glucanase
VTTLPVGERLSLLDEAVPDTSLPWPSLDHPLQPGARLSGPLPTNAWWLNAALGNGDGVINVLPYLVSVRDDQLAASLAYRVEAPNLVYTFRQDDLRLGAVETLQPPTVTAHDAASVTMTWTAPTGAMTTPLVRGMPYVTAIYDGLRPVVSTEHTIVAVNGQPPGVARSSDTFVVDLSSGQTLTVYASRFVTLDTSPAALTGLAPFDGWLRVAETTPATAAALAAHGDRVPTGAEVRATSQGDVGTLTFDWQTTGSGPLLMMTLPHHRDVLTGPTPVAVSADTIKGEMTGVAGTRWELVEPLTDITWGAPRPIDPQFEPDVRAALQADVNEGIGPLDPYFGGKAIAKVARLALIADELGETALAATYRNRVASALESWLSGTNPIPFRYDRTWGGLVTTESIANPGAQFGQGWYNDHHFHYGYFVYAAAVVAKEDPAWAAQWGDAVDHLVRDIAATGDDGRYGFMRNKDWFVGHSWAAGLFVFADSRNQESTSEAVNAWYGVYLWGLATGDDRVADLGRLALATEIRSAQRYWQIPAGSDIYGPPFADNATVGVLWSTKVDYNTFFGTNVEFIHGIQMLPFTPISEELMDPDWVLASYPVVSQALSNPGLAPGWRGFIHMFHGVVNQSAAWNAAQTLTGYDDGNTRTNTLYWLATRP